MILNKNNTISKRNVINLNSDSKWGETKPLYSFFFDMVDYMNKSFPNHSFRDNYDVEDFIKAENLIVGTTCVDSESGSFGITSKNKKELTQFIDNLNKLYLKK